MTTPFLDALPGQCRRPLWPLSQRTGDVCGDATPPGSPYCAACRGLLYDPSTPGRIRAIDLLAGRIVGDQARQQPAANIHPEFEDRR